MGYELGWVVGGEEDFCYEEFERAFTFGKRRRQAFEMFIWVGILFWAHACSLYFQQKELPDQAGDRKFRILTLYQHHPASLIIRQPVPTPESLQKTGHHQHYPQPYHHSKHAKRHSLLLF